MTVNEAPEVSTMEDAEHRTGERLPVVLVPGGVMPAGLSYGPLLPVIEDHVQAVLKELEVYGSAVPPSNYGLEMEVEGIKRAADAAGFESCHLVGYSAGGAASLAFAAAYPDRLRSLALIEPAWIGNDDQTAEDVADSAELDRVMTLPESERMRAFAVWQMRPGLEPPLPPSPPPPWMALRPAGLEALVRAFKVYRLDRQAFRRFRQPVYYALGNLSRAYYERNARTLAGLFPDSTVEVYEGRSHFDPPHRAEPLRFAQALRGLWARASEGRH